MKSSKVDSNKIVEFVRDTYQTNEFIPLHAPAFNGNEKQYVLETIDSTFVSSVGNLLMNLNIKWNLLLARRKRLQR